MEKELALPRQEHPRPSFIRNSWINLNGYWEFYNDTGASGENRKVFNSEKFDEKIIVPFCPESKLSGIQNVDFMTSVWYGKNIDISEEQLNGRIILHFGACDYKTTIYINGVIVGRHVGGYSSFEFDITEFVKAGKNRIVVHALDDVRSWKQPRGKQSDLYYSHHCDYTRTTGIWQTVWLEFVPQTYLKRVKINATDLNGLVVFEPFLNKYHNNAELEVKINYQNNCCFTKKFKLDGVSSLISAKIEEIHLWNVNEPNLYDVTFTLYIDDKKVDEVNSYFGIRRIDIDGLYIKINGKTIFQRLILDQGFYPDGIYTAPSDEDLKNDIKLSQAIGFNGARLHQKVFEERFLYHADKLGYIVWGEYPDWGQDINDPYSLHTFLPEWIEVMERDYNHPCIITWCPHNETWRDSFRRPEINGNIDVIYKTTKAIDKTRPVIDNSGGYHSPNTDFYDVHDYEQNVDKFKERYQEHLKGNYYTPFADIQTHYDGKLPYFNSEFGGIKWHKRNALENDMQASWGYGDSPKTEEEYVERFCGLCEVMLSNPSFAGFCYTQLTDVEQEQNGIYYYDRSPKFKKELYERMKASCSKKSIIEND